MFEYCFYYYFIGKDFSVSKNEIEKKSNFWEINFWTVKELKVCFKCIKLFDFDKVLYGFLFSKTNIRNLAAQNSIHITNKLYECLRIIR